MAQAQWMSCGKPGQLWAARTPCALEPSALLLVSALHCWLSQGTALPHDVQQTPFWTVQAAPASRDRFDRPCACISVQSVMSPAFGAAKNVQLHDQLSAG